MAKKDPGVLSAILSAQKEKTGGEVPSLKSVEDALSGVSTISAADLKAILSGGSIGAPANNVIEIAQDIKQITENTDIEAKESEKVSDNIEQLVEIQQDLLPTKEEKTEEIELFRDQNDILSKIEENTRSVMSPQGIIDSSSTASQSGGASTGLLAGAAGLAGGLLGGGLLGGGIKGIMGLFGKGAGAAVGEAGAASVGSTLIKGITGFIGNIFKTLMKGAIITMLVGGLINGLVDGIEEYKKSGDISKALWKGFAGFIEFLSLGLIDEDDINYIKDSIKEKGVFGFISDSISKLISSAVEFITSSDLFKDLKQQYEDVGIGMMLVNGLKSWATAIIDLWFGEGTADKIGESILNKFNEIKELATGFVETIKSIYNELIDSLISLIKEIHIPKFGFTVPLPDVFGGDKEFSFGPYYPFGKNEENSITNSTSTNIENSSNVLLTKLENVNNKENSSNVLLTKSENTTAENVITQNEENALIQQNMMATGAPSTIYAPTTNNNNSKQTTIMPPIKVRNDEDPMMKILMGEGGW